MASHIKHSRKPDPSVNSAVNVNQFAQTDEDGIAKDHAQLYTLQQVPTKERDTDNSTESNSGVSQFAQKYSNVVKSTTQDAWDLRFQEQA